MIISYLGGECFKVSQGDLTLAFNPPSKDSNLKSPKFGSDIVLSTIDHEDMNGVENASFGERAPFVIQGPGEYEVRGVVVHGFASPSAYGGGTALNTIYSVTLEGMNLAFLGALGGELPHDAKEELDDIDILFVPIGGEGVLEHTAAYKLAVQLGPRVVIPMHYGEVGAKDALKAFLKEAGAEGVAPVDKLTVKKKDLEGKEAEVVVLAA